MQGSKKFPPHSGGGLGGLLLASLRKERQPIRACPEEGHKNDQEDGTPLL